MRPQTGLPLPPAVPVASAPASIGSQSLFGSRKVLQNNRPAAQLPLFQRVSGPR